MSATSEQMRIEWLHNDTERDKGLKTPDDVVRYDDISYGPEQKWNLLDVYRPKAAKSEKLPVIVIVHGGGWVYGTKEIYQFYGMNLAQHGFAVVSFNYRLAPEYKFPASFEDASAVLHWIFENADEYGLDTQNIILAGDSAGGHMTGIITAIITDPEYAAHFPTVKFPKEFMPKALLLNCGVYLLYDKEGRCINDVNEDLMHDFLNEETFDADKKLLNVVDHVNGKFPPAYIMTAEGDYLQDQAFLLAEKYREHHLEHVYRIFGDRSNELFHVFHVTIYNPNAVRCNDEECAFAKEFVN